MLPLLGRIAPTYGHDAATASLLYLTGKHPWLTPT